ncbi:ECF-type riboflavin transporter substrate-binding protein [Fructobacillus sp. CRL 2054]|uniref:ECF-type riboflavin transporter substrate-binding protein n=1 Tax=Fructobacillus sp. CRL 2054 TaxID=2763007 RepID=UPI0023799513|nr:ECF-type riboflavin transporter substrate-binding protein [Fructobacillus sp. CRL 2054]MDD9138070.1 ECF-type riboflavin transporter substrate-binding protein [Fructobacillus sp. CRL 2054]
MKKKGLSTKDVVAIGIGAAVFLILFKFVAIPTGIPNTQVNVAQSWLSLISILFSPMVGFFVAILGHSLNDAISYGSIWWSWVIADGCYAFIFALLVKRAHLLKGALNFWKVAWFNISQLIANLIAWLLIAPTLDIVIYAEPANKVYLQGGLSVIVNVISTGIIGTTLLSLYLKNKGQQTLLRKED